MPPVNPPIAGTNQAQGFRVEHVEERWARRLAAVNLEGVRLIDNLPVAEKRTLRFLG